MKMPLFYIYLYLKKLVLLECKNLKCENGTNVKIVTNVEQISAKCKKGTLNVNGCYKFEIYTVANENYCVTHVTV